MPATSSSRFSVSKEALDIPGRIAKMIEGIPSSADKVEAALKSYFDFRSEYGDLNREVLDAVEGLVKELSYHSDDAIRALQQYEVDRGYEPIGDSEIRNLKVFTEWKSGGSKPELPRVLSQLTLFERTMGRLLSVEEFGELENLGESFGRDTDNALDTLIRSQNSRKHRVGSEYVVNPYSETEVVELMKFLVSVNSEVRGLPSGSHETQSLYLVDGIGKLLVRRRGELSESQSEAFSAFANSLGEFGRGGIESIDELEKEARTTCSDKGLGLLMELGQKYNGDVLEQITDSLKTFTLGEGELSPEMIIASYRDCIDQITEVVTTAVPLPKEATLKTPYLDSSKDPILYYTLVAIGGWQERRGEEFSSEIKGYLPELVKEIMEITPTAHFINQVIITLAQVEERLEGHFDLDTLKEFSAELLDLNRTAKGYRADVQGLMAAVCTFMKNTDNSATVQLGDFTVLKREDLNEEDTRTYYKRVMPNFVYSGKGDVTLRDAADQCDQFITFAREQRVPLAECKGDQGDWA